MLIPLLLGAGLLGGAAVAAWKMIQEGRGSGQMPGDSTPGGNREPGQDDDGQRSQHDSDQRQDEMLRRVVDNTEFTVKQMVVDQRVVGTERHPSQIPADDIEIRRIRGISEIGSVLPGVHAMDDDVFYGQLAAQNLPVTEHIQKIDLTEDVMGESRNILIILHDVSSSMEEGQKIVWAIRLCELLLDRCIEQGAECILIPYRNEVEDKHSATNEAECRQLQRELSYVLRPGGGTCTNTALFQVLEFLKDEKFGEVRIMLVTDGEDYIDVSGIRKGLDELGAYLHTVCIAPTSNNELQRASDRYDYLSFN